MTNPHASFSDNHQTLVVAVVIAYNSDEHFGERLDSYREQVASVVIVDNSTDEEASKRILLLSETRPNIILHSNGGNIGLAKAQNVGLEEALKQKPEWIFLLDDDSVVPDGTVTALLAAHAQSDFPERVGIVAPVVVDQNAQTTGRVIVSDKPWHVWRKPAPAAGTLYSNALTVIASGSLIRAEALAHVGMFEDKYFVDSIDTEFALRMRKAGYDLVVSGNARLNHRLGKKTKHQKLGTQFITTNHPAWRRYTMYRNRVDVWKKYFNRFPAYVVYDFLVGCFELLKVAAFEGEKSKKIGLSFKGAWHGLSGNFEAKIPF